MRSTLLLFLSTLLVLVVGDQSCEAKKSWADVAKSSEGAAATISDNNGATCNKNGVKRKSSWADIAGSGGVSKAKSNNVQQPPAKKVKTTPKLKRGTAVYAKLPDGAERHMVRNVYDGDTLTLTDGRRVRFLGIDTPELSDNQPYAKEAKAYARKYCHKKEIYLTFDKFGDKQDKFGRLLAFVWAVDKVEGGYLCVNEGLVANGLATVYLPRKDAKLANLRKMIALQKEARNAKRNIWANFVDYKVLVTPFGSAYHRDGCKHIRNNRNLKTMTASAAADKGLHPCRTCLADA